MKETSDTICAISTPLGMGAIGMVRLSGSGAVGIAEKIFRPNNPEVGIKDHSHRIIYGKVVNPADGGIVDEALLTFMKAPRTYTREDTIEINCHGGPAAVRRVLGLAASAGARLAFPGEFTRRAFMNGRIDLTQAEAVMDVIAARTEASLQAAVSQLGGGLRQKVGAVREGMAALLALTEASIDFPEEENDYIPVEDLKAKGEAILSGVRNLLATYDEGRILRDGLRAAIIGRPNVGKSSLLNRLAGAERAIVTETPGTTRDTVEETINAGGVPVRVMDTAGIRDGGDEAEREGVRRSLMALADCDLALLVLDGSRPLADEDRAIMEKLSKINHITIINKMDLPQALDTAAPQFNEGRDGSFLRVSAKTGEGLDALTARVREAAFGGGRERPPEASINLRHRICLERAGAALERFDSGCREGLSPEFLALELREALDAVGEVVGRTAPEEILDMIFERFCIGK